MELDKTYGSLEEMFPKPLEDILLEKFREMNEVKALLEYLENVFADDKSINAIANKSNKLIKEFNELIGVDGEEDMPT